MKSNRQIPSMARMCDWRETHVGTRRSYFSPQPYLLRRYSRRRLSRAMVRARCGSTLTQERWAPAAKKAVPAANKQTVANACRGPDGEHHIGGVYYNNGNFSAKSSPVVSNINIDNTLPTKFCTNVGKSRPKPKERREQIKRAGQLFFLFLF